MGKVVNCSVDKCTYNYSGYCQSDYVDISSEELCYTKEIDEEDEEDCDE